MFASWGRETVKPFAKEELERILAELDYVPEEHQVRAGPADYTGRLCVIGAGLKEEKLSALFGL